MITEFKIFENKEFDLREMSKHVRCVNDVRGFKGFREGKIYKVVKIFGDPQRSIEEFAINNYLPLECISFVHIEDDKKSAHRFVVNEYYNHETNRCIRAEDNYFKDYFEIMEEEIFGNKYNI